MNEMFIYQKDVEAGRVILVYFKRFFVFIDFVVDNPDMWERKYGVAQFHRIIRKYAESKGFSFWFNLDAGCLN